MAAIDDAREALSRIAGFVADLDLVDAEGARARLTAALPLKALGDVRAIVLRAHAEGSLTPSKAGAISFGRVSKAVPSTFDHAIDAVDIEGVGAEHTHPRGEVSLCFATAGDPRFDGHPEGWVVKPPGSHHAPTVTGGRMLIVYFLPGGAMKWGPQA
jgi:hypothetical protein